MYSNILNINRFISSLYVSHQILWNLFINCKLILMIVTLLSYQVEIVVTSLNFVMLLYIKKFYMVVWIIQKIDCVHITEVFFKVSHVKCSLVCSEWLVCRKTKHIKCLMCHKNRFSKNVNYVFMIDWFFENWILDSFCLSLQIDLWDHDQNQVDFMYCHGKRKVLRKKTFVEASFKCQEMQWHLLLRIPYFLNSFSPGE